MKKRHKKIWIWFVLGVYLVVASSVMTNRTGNVLCNSIHIMIDDTVTNNFVRKSDVTEQLEKDFRRIVGKPVKEINTYEIKESLDRIGVIKSCNVYTTLDGKLNIEIKQRTPIVRIINKYNQSYYVDAEGYIIHKSKHFTPRVLVVNGNIKSYFPPGKHHNILNDSIQELKLRRLYDLSKYIYNDEFWKAQIVQVYVKKNDQIDIVPRIGPHLIEFGSPENYEQKLKKLKTFYKEGLNKVGWNKYEIINISYKDQIVCTKR
jgi:cell division protein FtsQ